MAWRTVTVPRPPGPGYHHQGGAGSLAPPPRAHSRSPPQGPVLLAPGAAVSLSLCPSVLPDPGRWWGEAGGGCGLPGLWVCPGLRVRVSVCVWSGQAGTPGSELQGQCVSHVCPPVSRALGPCQVPTHRPTQTSRLMRSLPTHPRALPRPCTHPLTHPPSVPPHPRGWQSWGVPRSGLRPGSLQPLPQVPGSGGALRVCRVGGTGGFPAALTCGGRLGSRGRLGLVLPARPGPGPLAGGEARG